MMVKTLKFEVKTIRLQPTLSDAREAIKKVFNLWKISDQKIKFTPFLTSKAHKQVRNPNLGWPLVSH